MRTDKNKLCVGDIFSLKLDDGKYAFGRCIAEISIGHIVEIFDYYSDQNVFDTTITDTRLFEPIPIDTWGLFGRRKKEGEWKVIGHETEFTPKNVSHLRYWGCSGTKANTTKLLGVFDNEYEEIDIVKVNCIDNRKQLLGLHFKIKDKGWENIIFLLRSPWGDFAVKKEIEKYRR
jgi:hypothetical protein